MLAKINRLSSKGLFKRTLSHGQRLFACPQFAVLGLKPLPPQPNPEETLPLAPLVFQPRFGFIVSKKVHKRAVRRNRIRRVLQETLRQQVLKTGLGQVFAPYRAVVFIVREAALGITSAEALDQLQQLVQRLQKKGSQVG